MKKIILFCAVCSIIGKIYGQENKLINFGNNLDQVPGDAEMHISGAYNDFLKGRKKETVSVSGRESVFINDRW
jgi:hypothetical protein